MSEARYKKNKVVRCPRCGLPGVLSFKTVTRRRGSMAYKVYYLVVDHRSFGYNTIHTIRRLPGPPDRREVRRRPVEERAPVEQPSRPAGSQGGGGFLARPGSWMRRRSW
jgi:adenine-specific DNA methylase